MIRTEFEELMQLSIEAGTIKGPIAYEKYMADADSSGCGTVSSGHHVTPAGQRRWGRHASARSGPAHR